MLICVPMASYRTRCSPQAPRCCSAAAAEQATPSFTPSDIESRRLTRGRTSIRSERPSLDYEYDYGERTMDQSGHRVSSSYSWSILGPFAGRGRFSTPSMTTISRASSAVLTRTSWPLLADIFTVFAICLAFYLTFGVQNANFPSVTLV